MITGMEKALEYVATTGFRINICPGGSGQLGECIGKHGETGLSEKPQVIGMTGGALGLSALALAFGLCCVAPWAVTLLGVAGAVMLARLAFIQPYVVAGTIVLLGIGFWCVYRIPRANAICDVAQQRRLRRLVWIATIVVLVFDVASFAPRFLP